MLISKRIMKAATATTLALLMASALPGLAPGGLGAAQAASEETVHIGQKHVHIIRGDAPQGPVASQGQVARNAAPAREQRRIEPVAGLNGWFFDNQTNKFGRCFTRNTTEYRGRTIRCVWRKLP